ncbi:hypothetical protein [Methylobacterium sp. J-092]|uniref:hypothetical protein n=1 Tax=Methylobacterium sp. J-092 TaxID=2836667 RepID=UPI001FBC0FBC|nr:hypothetical protein [Methylobacterium sp. J-092]MCJ2009777.1 hypothetical protein [Methylobacterium sp. J-092]
MRLIDYMRSENLDDAAMADRVGGITEHGIRKLKYGERGPSIEVAIRIDSVSGGKVGLHDWSKAHETTARLQVPPQTGAAA